MATNFVAVPMTENPPLPSAVLTPRPVPQPSEIAVEYSYKGKLQEYTQKASLPFPVYQTVKEGPPHATVFRSIVCVNGLQYLSSTVFLQRKSAEQDAARVALSSIPPLPQIVNLAEGPDLRPFINQDTTFSKSILNEYAAKKRIEKPVYATIGSGEKVPVFSSSVVLDGNTYHGHAGRNKKEAEQLAARAGVLSILDSEDGKVIYEIIKSKHKLYAVINGLKETLGGSNNVPILNVENRLDFDMNKRKQDGVTDVSINIPSSKTSFSTPNVPSAIQEAPPSHHEFKKLRLDAKETSLPPLITFVPASSQTVLPSMSGSQSVKKKKNNRKKNKKKTNQAGLQHGNDQSRMTSAVVLHPGTQ